MPIIVDPHAPGPVAPVNVVSSDGILSVTLDSYFGALLVATVPSGVTEAVTAVFVSDDGTGERPVRSGYAADVFGTTAVAYDNESPLGVGVSWRVYFFDASGAQLVASVPIATVIQPPGWPYDVILKSLEDPALSVQIITGSWAELSSGTQSTTVQALASRTPTVVLLGRTSGTSSLTCETLDVEEAAALRRLLDEEVLLLQTRPEYGRADQYVLLGDVTETMSVGAWNPRRTWVLALTEVTRPDPTGQGLRIPGRSFATRLAAYPTFSDVPSRTYLEALTG